MTTHVVDQSRATLQTTDGTQSTLLSYTLLDDSIYAVSAQVAAKDTSGNGKMFVLDGAFKRTSGGGATLIGSVVSVITAQGDAGAATWSATMDTSSNTIRVRVTGAAATTINWVGRIVLDGYVP